MGTLPTRKAPRQGWGRLGTEAWGGAEPSQGLGQLQVSREEGAQAGPGRRRAGGPDLPPEASGRRSGLGHTQDTAQAPLLQVSHVLGPLSPQS